MNKLIIASLIGISILSLSGCNSFSGKQSTPAPESSISEEPKSEATIQPTVDGTPVSIDCSSDGLWTCNSQYGGTIKTVDYLVGTVSIAEYFSDFGTVDAQIEAYKTMRGWDGQDIEKFELNDATGAILKGGSNSKTHMFFIKKLKGKDDYGVKCAATVEADKFSTYKSGIEEMCGSLRSS